MRKTPVIALIAFLVAAGLALLVAPPGSRLDDATSGDPALAERVRDAVGDGRGFQSLSVAEITADSVTYAGVGSMAPGSGEAPQPETLFELGSITKTFTGLALARAVEDGTINLDDALEKHLDELEGTPAGGVTMGDLAAHRSGLPSMSPPQLVNMLAQFQLGADIVPGITEEQILTDAKTAQITSPAEYEYSNFGATLTGLAVARAEGTAWSDLIAAQVLEPIGMSDTEFVATTAAIPPMPDGYRSNGNASVHSCCNAQIPAGSGTMTSATDVAAYAQAMLEPDAAAELALTPRHPTTSGHIGLFWHLNEIDGRAITWHNGGTAAFKTILAIDREKGTAVLVMGNTDRDVDGVGFGLLTERPVPSPGLPITGLVFLGIFALLAVSWLVQFWRAAERTPVVSPLLWLTAFALLTRELGPWQLVPGLTWAVLVGTAVAAVTLTLSRGREERPQRSIWKTIYTVFDIAVAVVALAVGIILSIPRV